MARAGAGDQKSEGVGQELLKVAAMRLDKRLEANNWGRWLAALLMAAGMAVLWRFPAAGQDQKGLAPPPLGPPPVTAPVPSPPASPQTGSTADADQAPAVPELPLPPVTISAKVDRPLVPQKARVNYIVTITWDQAATVEEYPLDFEFPEPPAAEGMVLYANSFKAVTELTGSRVRVTRTYTYEFYADQQGATEIKPAVVKYFRLGSKTKSELKTQALPLTVTRPEIRIAEVVRNPIFIIIAAVLLAAGIAVGVVRSLRARRERKAAAVPVRSPQEIAAERLAAADRLRMAGDYVEFLRALAVEMRRYSEDALGVKARGQSLTALGPLLAEKLGEEWKGRLAEFEKLGDKVKFAGYEPKSAELDAAMMTAKDLVAEGEKISVKAQG
jgi:hypothetical protein